MNITSAQYRRDMLSGEIDLIVAVIDGEEMYVPIYERNRHYKEIMRQSEAGTLTIAEAE